MKFLLSLLINALALAAAAWIVPGIAIDGFGTLIIAALIWGFVNAIIRPVLLILTLPITILTLGIFVLVLNAALFALVAWLLPGFQIAGFGSALLGWIIVTIVGWVTAGLTHRI